jgi:hypothetical protein
VEGKKRGLRPFTREKRGSRMTSVGAYADEKREGAAIPEWPQSGGESPQSK